MMNLRFDVIVPVLGAVALLAVGPSAARAQPDPKVVERNRALVALIDRFLASPLDGRLRTSLMDSGYARKDIKVELSTNMTPWECYGDPQQDVIAFDSTLTTAFVAGNMRPQLEEGRRKDRPHPGLEAVLRVYDVLKRELPNYYVPEVERWLGRDPSTRSSLADSLKRAPVRDCPEDPPRRYRGRVRVRVVPDSSPQ
jgi:hypothetical protein